MTVPRATDFVRDPLLGVELHRTLASARERGRVTHAKLIGADAYLITRFADVRAFLADLDRFPAGSTYEAQVEPTVGRTFISMDAAEHDAYRDLAMPAFRSRPAARFVEEELVPLAHEIIDRFVDRGEGDLVELFAKVLPFWAISRKVGLPLGSEEQQRRWALALLSYPGSPEKALAASREVTEFLDPIIDERRRDPRDDVLSHLLAAESDGVGMSDEDVVSHVRLLYAVGATTTSDALSSLLWALLTVPDLYERARDDEASRKWIVHESLRTEPPVAVLPRLAVEGGEIGGVDVPRGALVLAAIAGANRDRDAFDRPDVFDPDRPEKEQITFGAGAKFCPGHHIARRQLEAALDAVLERLPDLRAVDTEPPSGGVLRTVKRLHVKWRT